MILERPAASATAPCRRPPGGPCAPTRGAALVIALLVMAMLALLGTTFLTVSSTETEIARNAREAIQAFYLAETGLARLKRDLVAQFAVPYRAVCPTPGAYADLTRSILTAGEPLGVPGQAVDVDQSATCAPPRTTAYYRFLDAQNQPVSPVGTTWRLVPYVADGVGGTYRVEVRNATPPDAPAPLLPNTIEAQVTATTGTATGASRQIQARFQVDRFSPAEHALFVDGGVWRWGGGGNITLAGPVFAKGWSASYPALQLGYGGAADTIVNSYRGLDATLQSAIPPAPVRPNPVTGESEVTLEATLRVYQGPVEIRSSSSSVGEATVAGNGVKESLNGVYTNQGFTGVPGAAQVYADSGTGSRLDLPREMTTFPDLTGPYTGAPLPPGGATPASHDAYLRANGLGIEGGLTIDSTTPSFSYPPGLADLSQCSGNCLIYRQAQEAIAPSVSNPTGSPATPPLLSLNGVVWVKGDIVLGGSGAVRLPAILYKGTGSLYSQTGTPDSWGWIEVTSDVLPSPLKNDGTSGAQFPTDHRLGLVSAGWVTIGDWSTAAGASPPPPLRLAAGIYADYGMYNSAPYQVAGSVMARYFYVWQSAGIYYVPSLGRVQPPGMPGATPSKAESPYFARTLSWRDVMP